MPSFKKLFPSNHHHYRTSLRHFLPNQYISNCNMHISEFPIYQLDPSYLHPLWSTICVTPFLSNQFSTWQPEISILKNWYFSNYDHTFVFLKLKNKVISVKDSHYLFIPASVFPLFNSSRENKKSYILTFPAILTLVARQGACNRFVTDAISSGICQDLKYCCPFLWNTDALGAVTLVKQIVNAFFHFLFTCSYLRCDCSV